MVLLFTHLYIASYFPASPMTPPSITFPLCMSYFIIVLFFFFFSSRRRHTRFKCDWSSDVCSSDLFGSLMLRRYDNGLVPQGISADLIAQKSELSREQLDEFSLESHRRAARATEIGRASCRERV